MVDWLRNRVFFSRKSSLYLMISQPPPNMFHTFSMFSTFFSSLFLIVFQVFSTIFPGCSNGFSPFLHTFPPVKHPRRPPPVNSSLFDTGGRDLLQQCHARRFWGLATSHGGALGNVGMSRNSEGFINQLTILLVNHK